ncbi:MAG: hypothetical protein JWM16_3670 [Verrucomicrobiales bacterium]|nr:hypothetical protein [Verrucomicrobiales bacterium]
MKKLAMAVLLVIGLAVFNPFGSAQERGGGQRYEFAMVKWDGPDKMQYIYPNRFESVKLSQNGVSISKDAQNEEFCLTAAANRIGKEGWEAVNLDSRRILFRRPVGQ